MANTSDPSVVQRLPMLELTMSGLEKVLTRMYSKQSQVTEHNITVMVIGDPDNLETYLQNKDKPLKLPFIGITPIQVEPDLESFNTQVLRRIGRPLGRTSDNQTVFVFKGSPIALTFQISFVTDDYTTLLRIIDSWQATQIWNFRVRLEEIDKPVEIRLVPEKGMSIPPRQKDSGSAEQFRLTTTMKAHTYSGYLWRIPTVAKVSLSVITSNDLEDALDTSSIPYLTRTQFDIIADPLDPAAVAITL